MSTTPVLTPIAFATFREKFLPQISLKAAQSVLELAAEGGTVPFIARYRKEKTGGLDETEIRAVIEGNETLTELNKRREFVVTEIQSQGNLTDELKARITTCMDLGDLEEIYRPYKKKKKTKATLAREAGLEPLADWLWKIGHMEAKPDVAADRKAKNFCQVPYGD